tara:strand:+ start:151 stop:411 length:261 start_codon:yes stop_codon:yes gene_type:complete
MTSKSKDVCPVLPVSANRSVCTSAIVGLGVGIGAYMNLRNSNLKIMGVEKWDLQKNKYFVPAASISLALLGASLAGSVSYLLSNRH